jgi:UDP-N-acetyl-alpha-D-muramoyl-L-alanyl-L-glutamate epimerase
MLKPKMLIHRLKKVRSLWVEPPPRNRVLIYHGFEIAFPEVTYRYSTGGREFVNRVTLSCCSKEQLERVAPEVVARILDGVGLIFTIYCFSLADFAAVHVESRSFPASSRPFWEDFAYGALGEFRFVNGLDPRRRVKFVGGSADEMLPPPRIDTPPRLLLLNGGGKDSVVSLELLKAMRVPFDVFSVDPNPTRDGIIALSGDRESLHVEVKIDPSIQSHSRYPWWPEAAGALVCFLAQIPAVVHGYRYVALGNEHSADFGNVRYRGIEINHQYDKSSEFEKNFDEYIQSFVVQGIHTFSLLRPLYDLRIAEIFTRFERYFPVFVSCNNGIKDGVWCKRCPKCAFVYVALRSFLDEEPLRRIFGEDLLQHARIRRHILDMVAGRVRPWECIGTKDECRLALRLTLDRMPGRDFLDWPRRKHLEAPLRSFDVEAHRRRYLEGFHEPHRIPEELAGRLKGALASLA